MAIPTNFQGYTPSAGATKSFKILGTATVGIWANDVDGTLSATCSQISIGPGLVLFMSQTYTDAQLLALMRDYLQRHGSVHDGPGGQVVEGSGLLALSGVTCT